MKFRPCAAAAAVFLLSGTAFADNPPVVLADSPVAPGLPGESFRNRLELSLGFGVGTLSPTQYNSYINTSFNAPYGGSPTGDNVNTELHFAFLFTYYAPYYLLLRSGIEGDSFAFPSETLPNGDQLKNYGGIAEVPIEFGGHYSFLQDKLIVELAAGPAIAGYTSAGLSGSTSPSGQQYYASPTVGFDSELRGQYFLSGTFSLGLELGYRILSAGPLHDSSNANVIVGGNTVNLDMSGFHAELVLGFAII